ncbi:MAG: protein translocase subunit SecD, partial [Rubrobacter sp.]|nr:protein translocase subunit SecD [Rubrobacter sp.]
VLPTEPGLTGSALDSATLARDQQGRREVQMELTSEGAEGFGELSQEIVDDALANGRPGRGQLAVVLDEDVVSAPVVEQPIYGGQVSINNQGLPGGLPQKEAEELEVVLKTGALPVNMEVLSVTSIGPTLGSDSLRSGLLASLVGFGLVLVFLVVVYRALGLVADLALLIYAFLLWGLIVAIPITLTLPGLAGIVLSIGVAADANVVIFERIKEEIRRGKSLRTAVGLGYQKGFAAILDGNLTTLITALILFALSSGSVRGFAVLLAVGVILSMFTAVSVTRALLGVVSGRGVKLSPGMMGVSKKSLRERQPQKAKAGVR